MNTLTATSTYTSADVEKVVDRFTADFHMIAQATGLASANRVVDVGHDVKLMALRGYIERVDIVLRNVNGREVRAAKYTVSYDASMWSSDRPGDNLWPPQVAGALHVVVSYSDAWWALSEMQRQAFHDNECRRPWGVSDIDLRYPELRARANRRYSSNGYGLERTVYEEE